MVEFNIRKNTVIIQFNKKPLNNKIEVLLLDHLAFKKDSFDPNIFYKTLTTGTNIDEIKLLLKRNGYDIDETDNFKELEEVIKEELNQFNRVKEIGLKAKEVKVNNENFPELKRQLYDFQARCVYHLLKISNGANFSVTGSGKTMIVYSAYSHWKKSNDLSKLLVIGPSSSFMSWEDEYFLCFGKEINSVRLLGPNREKFYKKFKNYEIFLTTYQTATRDQLQIIEMLSQDNFMVVLDESHYIKRFEGGKWANAILNIAPYAKKRVILSGTPMPQGYEDLYSQFLFLWPRTMRNNLLGNRNLYKKRLRNLSFIEALKEELEPFYIRIKKEDLNLKKPDFERVRIDLSSLQKIIYDSVAARTLEHVNELKNYEKSVFRHWQRYWIVYLREISSNPSLLMKKHIDAIKDDLNKAKLNKEQIPELKDQNLIQVIREYLKHEIPNKILKTIEITEDLITQGHKVLIWVYFIGNIHLIEDLLKKKSIECYTIYGEIPVDLTRDESEEIINELKTREARINKFRQSDKPCVLIANPFALAESVSLHHACHHAIYVDRNFNCGRYLQSLDRIHRIGLDPEIETKYYLLISKNTIDEVIDSRLNKKAEVMYNLLNDELPIGFFGDEADLPIVENEMQQDFEALEKQIREIYASKKENT
ncbi:MAG: DEAD/DEAH box helicase [Patescibacteria group bacterium]|nr:DEAD/DEAH box helicase [Patescibacteria group bacterium]